MVYLALSVVAASLLYVAYWRIPALLQIHSFIDRRRVGYDGAKQSPRPIQQQEAKEDPGRTGHPYDQTTSESIQNGAPAGSPRSKSDSQSSLPLQPKIHLVAEADTAQASRPKSMTSQEAAPSPDRTSNSLNSLTTPAIKMPPPTPPPSAPRAVSPASPPRPANSTLMPPPSVRPSAIRPLPSAPAPPASFAAGLRAAPTASRAPTSSLAPSSSTRAPAARPSHAVALAAGRSPLDWAQLTRHPPSPGFLRGPGVPPVALLRVSPGMLRRRNGRRGMPAWTSYQGRVYNVTPYLEYHPGGAKELMKGVGRVGVAERLFGEVHPWVNWEGMLGECAVGILVGEGEGDEDGEGAGELAGADRRRLEDMD